MNLLKLPNLLFGDVESNLVKSIVQLQNGNDLHINQVLGQYALISQDKKSIYLIRDRLGINKLFYHLDRGAQVLTVGSFLFDVAEATRDYNNIYSVPPGHSLKVELDTLTTKLSCYYDISRTEQISKDQFTLSRFQAEVDQRLAQFFKDLNNRFNRSLFVVCLSGGLDSSVIAFYAKKYLKNVKAVTFSFGDAGKNELSEDFQAGAKLAECLGLEFIPVVSPRNFSQSNLTRIIKNCQDWRDFNVHCAWLNDIIGDKVRGLFPTDDLVFLTGDLMNEYVADYTPVPFKDTVYYPQPKVSRDRLRRFFVYGLDTSDREVGIFNQYGITTVQPYAILAESYLSVPEEIINQDGCKETLNLRLVNEAKAAQHIVKKKVRAQVGGSDGGVLALFHENSVGQENLKRCWDEIYSPFSKEKDLRAMIVSGRYRSQ